MLISRVRVGKSKQKKLHTPIAKVKLHNCLKYKVSIFLNIYIFSFRRLHLFTLEKCLPASSQCDFRDVKPS